MYLAKEVILKKRDGLPLTREDIDTLVHGIAGGVVSDAQIAAFAMATWFRGMNLDEKMALTLAMRDSGQVLDWPALNGPVLDKHSTGGVGDLVSIVLGPVLAACGAYVPMISGRGLGHTGGTVDKLESIPGFDTSLGIERLQQLVRRHGVAIIGQTAELSPADRRVYAVRDVTATVSSRPLIVSSILSKKLAEGLDALVMDIKFGSGAVTPALSDAQELAREITQVASRAGLRCNALITDMNQPLCWSAGNALEIREAIGFLRGDARHQRLFDVVLALSIELLVLGGLAATEEQAREMTTSALDSGSAAERFARMVAAQKGPPDLIENPDAHLAKAAVVKPVFSDREGFISAIDTKAVGMAVVNLGGGRQRAEDNIDPSVGIAQIRRVGQSIDRDTPLGVIHAANQDDWDLAAAMLKAATTTSPVRGETSEVVYEKVEGEGIDGSG
jgi:thymidine phosphorylase